MERNLTGKRPSFHQEPHKTSIYWVMVLLGLIIVATATPDMAFPSTACLVQDKIGAGPAYIGPVPAGGNGWLPRQAYPDTATHGGAR